ncbi:peptidoglycan editing factor PgeF [Ottowia sp.]|uniref:peptidoglycan editing factor PgeF n=1 Tax=Ottowia sp. TaxID=1898956 RepID=UPI003A8AD16C
MSLHIPALQPDWPAPPRVRAMFTLRGGGVQDGASTAPRQFFNLGDHVGDAPAAVAANRQRLMRAMAQKGGARPVFMQQVHGVQVAQLVLDTADGVQADAAVCAQPGVACTVMVADCLPVLFTNATGSVVAAAHAGWRGLAAGVLEQTLERFRALAYAQQAQGAIKNEFNEDEVHEVMAWLGPCIGPSAFEVGAEVRDAFVAQDASAVTCFQPLGAGQYLADLPALARRRLAVQGVTRVFGNDGSARWCTVAQPAHFFSYRRDQAALGGSGRMAACIWLT